METGESSGSSSGSDDIWAKLVPSDSTYSDIELKSNEMTICSEIKSSSNEKHEWCKITREKDQASAVIQNTSSHSILVDGTMVQCGDTAIVRGGSEIILGSQAEGFIWYTFKAMLAPEICKALLKINLNPEHATCSICLNVWHDVVTVAPCCHNFCNGCLSQWLEKGLKRRTTILCPQCRATIQSVARNHFLHTIEENLLESDSSLTRSKEDIADLDSRSLIKSHLTLGDLRELEKQLDRVNGNENQIDSVPAQVTTAEVSSQALNSAPPRASMDGIRDNIPRAETERYIPTWVSVTDVPRQLHSSPSAPPLPAGGGNSDGDSDSAGSDSDSDSDGDSDSDSDSDRYSDGGGDREGNSDSHSYSDEGGNCECEGNSDSYSYSDDGGDCECEGNGDSYSHGGIDSDVDFLM